MSKIINVCGNKGKTLFAYNMAEILSVKNKVILISTNPMQPVYNMLFPGRKREKGQRSLGRLLSMPVISGQDIFQNAHVVNDNLLFICYAENENKKSYPEITDANCSKLLFSLEKIADYIVADTSTDPTAIDNYLLNSTNCTNILITTADLKGHYARRHFKNSHINIVWPDSPQNAMQDTLANLDYKPYILPFVKDLLGAYNGLDVTDFNVGKAYRYIINDIITGISKETQGD